MSHFLSAGFIALAANMPKTSDVQYKMELVVAIKSGGVDISLEAALEHVYGYGLGLDMTRSDLQGEAKKLGRLWEVGKSSKKICPDERACPSKCNGTLGSGSDLSQGQW